ncbi:hypothetical protein BC938DRAFT_481171 [Jimgerdemannia flammicorona]|uniref:UDENN domain-containing protein n=1 Tax=Jimgerdemannia flammicorona TaxID=994334 RepID=A0A433QGQ4_9FUNG|nr:hypothetical protein BC938DRAFT_481171 [Jimgerdemannia flammicorona]
MPRSCRNHDEPIFDVPGMFLFLNATAMDFVYPPVEFTEQEKKNICFSAFPDSNVFEVGDTVYNFRIRSNSKSGFAASGPTADAGFLYGYVFFRQKKDPRIRRGYFQKSIVLVSQHPYVGLFSRLISILGPAFCDVGKPMLEAACHNIASWYEDASTWPVFRTAVPRLRDPSRDPATPQATAAGDKPVRYGSAETGNADPRLGTHRHSLLSLQGHARRLVAVLGAYAPRGTSGRDGAGPECVQRGRCHVGGYNQPLSSFWERGSTNREFGRGTGRYFLLMMVPENSQRRRYRIVGIIGHISPSKTRISNPLSRRIRKPDGSLILHKTKGGKTANFLDFGVTSKRKSVITKDRALLKMFAEAAVRDVPAPHVLNNILRRHFVDLTEKFLVPLNRYFSTLIPVNMSLSGKQQPQLKPFSTDSFMKSLKEHGPQLPFKSAFSTRASATDVTKELYSHFLKCGNFATWLRLRTQEAQRELHKKYVQMLCDSDMREWMRGRHEVELVDLLLKVKHELRQGSDTADLSSSSTTFLSAAMSASSSTSTLAEDRPTTKQLELLHAQADVIIMGLPKDLRESLSLGNGGNGA